MKYFIDCGAHCGESIRRAKRTYEGFVIHSFEPITYFYNELYKIYENDNTVKLYNNAVWIEDCKKSFYISEKITDGSSLHIENASYFKVDKLNYIESECIDLSKWIINNLKKEDYIILKLDVEGSEYDILSKMINDGSIEYINELYGEWHQVYDYRKDLYETIMPYLQRNELILKIWEEYIDSDDINGDLSNRPNNLLNVLNTKIY